MHGQRPGGGGPGPQVGEKAGWETQGHRDDGARRGIGLIDPEEGAMSLLRELAWGDSTSVVLTASGW